jgi:hypothetical protein
MVTLSVIPGLFAICRLAPGAPMPPWVAAGRFLSITRTQEDLVAATEALSRAGHRVRAGTEAGPS